MKQILSFIIVSICLTSCLSAEKKVRERVLFTSDWSFSLSEGEYMDPNMDDSNWRVLNLPHDWSIEADFSDKYPATPGGGALPGGMGWYRKHFNIPEADKGKKIVIDFDGAYRESKVWINGHLLGYRPNGYISFRYDLTPYLNYGDKNNVIAVQVDNSKQPNSRWYSGSGIYRNVWLVKTGQVHVDNWGTYVTTPIITKDKAIVNIETTLRNHAEGKEVEVLTYIKDRKGKTVVSAVAKYNVPSDSSSVFSQSIELPSPELWTLENPFLYVAETYIKTDGEVTDSYETTFGVRSFRWDANTGFYLNDKSVKILGVCLHHDLGCLGTAINKRALQRQIEIMKGMGVNSIRTSHNPPAPEFLQLCDEMGILVQDETFDMWRRKKSKYDYALFFDEWYEKDLRDQILRDRNHASIFMWSIGNEVLEQWIHADAEGLSLQEANLILNAGHAVDPALLEDTTITVQQLITHTLTSIVKSLDTTRVVTAGCNEVSPGNQLFRAEALDVYGFNYHHKHFESFPRKFPEKSLIVSESTSGLMTRGYYEMPSDKKYIRPDRWDKPFEAPEHLCSSYDNCHVPWGSTHEETWALVKRMPHVSGMYIWTGFDYLGEPTPYGWPSRSSFFGVVDLAGIPKDIYYMYRSEWTNEDVLHVFPHWNWEEGETVDIWAYYNNADEVELFLNEKSLGAKSKNDSIFHVMWRIPFTKGTLKAVSRKDGKDVQTRIVNTAGEPAQIVLTADRDIINADRTDLSFITVEIKDNEGNLVPRANNLLRFSVEGEGFIAGTDNGDQNEPTSLKKPERKAFYGKAMAVVQNNGKKGTLRLTVSSDELPDASINIEVK